TETSSPTTAPPASIILFHVSPKSLRLSLVVADAPARVLPHGSLIGAVGPSTASVTSLVRPCSVRSPTTFHLPVPAASIFFELNVIVGYFATSRKLALLRSESRSEERVSIEAVSIVTSIETDA